MWPGNSLCPPAEMLVHADSAAVADIDHKLRDGEAVFGMLVAKHLQHVLRYSGLLAAGKGDGYSGTDLRGQPL